MFLEPEWMLQSKIQVEFSKTGVVHMDNWVRKCLDPA